MDSSPLQINIYILMPHNVGILDNGFYTTLLIQSPKPTMANNHILQQHNILHFYPRQKPSPITSQFCT